ncbi:MAG: hypothetical protein ABIL58_25920 [Pseudomonadota bacterium]
MDQYELLRTAHRVYGKTISELARQTGHSRNTIRKVIRGEPWGYSERQQQPFPAIGAYVSIIEGWLTKDKRSKGDVVDKRILNSVKRLPARSRFQAQGSNLTAETARLIIYIWALHWSLTAVTGDSFFPSVFSAGLPGEAYGEAWVVQYLLVFSAPLRLCARFLFGVYARCGRDRARPSTSTVSFLPSCTSYASWFNVRGLEGTSYVD